jgi:hypothetical protein
MLSKAIENERMLTTFAAQKSVSYTVIAESPPSTSDSEFFVPTPVLPLIPTVVHKPSFSALVLRGFLPSKTRYRQWSIAIRI